jgi:type II secretory pathway component PulF
MAERLENSGGGARLSAEDAAQLGAQIAGLTRANLPLPSGLRALGEELPAGRLRRMLGRLALSLEEGTSLEAAIDAQGGALPAHLRGLVQAGARTGRTGEVLGRFAGYTEIGAQVRRQLGLSLAYPILAMIAAGALLLFILGYLVGGFEQLLLGFGVQLPLLTMLVIELSSGLRNSWLPLAEGLVALGTIAVVGLVLIGPGARRSVLSWFPLLGPVWHWTSLAEYCHLLGLLLESELPLVEAVPMAGDAVPDAGIRSAAMAIRRDLAAGEPLARAIARRSLFPEGLAELVAWAEQHRSLPGALHMMGEMFEARARAQASFASAVCTVLSLIVILGGVLAVLFGLVAPLIQLIQKLSG